MLTCTLVAFEHRQTTVSSSTVEEDFQRWTASAFLVVKNVPAPLRHLSVTFFNIPPRGECAFWRTRSVQLFSFLYWDPS